MENSLHELAQERQWKRDEWGRYKFTSGVIKFVIEYQVKLQEIYIVAGWHDYAGHCLVRDTSVGCNLFNNAEELSHYVDNFIAYVNKDFQYYHKVTGFDNTVTW